MNFVQDNIAPLPSQRHLFDVPHDVAYLNCAFMSLVPKASIAAGVQGLGRKAHTWTIEPEHFFDDSETVRALFAQIINASVDDVALIPAVSYGMAQAAHNVPLHRGKKILTLAEEFPSNVYPWLNLAQRTSSQVVYVPRPTNSDWTAALLAQMDSSVGLVAVPHCHWTDGGLIDLEAVGFECRRLGALLCIDGSQSLGALPFDVKRIDPDFVAVGTYKWLWARTAWVSYTLLRVAQDATKSIDRIDRSQRLTELADLVTYKSEFQPGARHVTSGSVVTLRNA